MPTNYGYGEWVYEQENGVSVVVSSPGLFGSYPVVDYKRGYCAYLMSFNFESKGRQERYAELKKKIDAAIGF
jgi:hypothetical protein